ncbi:MAG TPA: BON domain-containing protein [Mycoplana sp.]|nr:BON domain-containing protein [Mycoplana sp.]
MNFDTPPDRDVDHLGLVESVRCALAMWPDIDLSGIEVAAEGHGIVLRGTCRSALAAATARQIAEEIAGEGHVRTVIVIEREADR